MKKVQCCMMAVLVVGLSSLGFMSAKRENGLDPRSLLWNQIIDGSAFTYEEALVKGYTVGHGLVVATHGGTLVKIYGIGSRTYWREMGVKRPGVGDTVSVSAVSVEVDARPVNVALWIRPEDQSTPLLLRHPETGEPLWRKVTDEADMDTDRYGLDA